MNINFATKSYKKYIKYLLIFFTIFFLGILTERFGLDHRFTGILKSIFDSTSRFFYSFNSSEKIQIEIKQKQYDEILKVREKSLKQNYLTEDLNNWVPAKLNFNDNKRNIRIRLKGVFPDHWTDPVQWSFKIRVEEDSKAINGLRRFALQPPRTLSYIYEWLFMKALEKENLISLGVNYIDLMINETNRGVYTFQGQISDDLLKKNNRVVGPVIGFDSSLWIKERMNAERLTSIGIKDSLNGLEDSFFRAKIKPVQFSNENIETEQELYLKKAIKLLESFRNKSLKPSQVFDTDQLAKVMALRAILGSSEFDWVDTKFYFNPKTSLLEPISKESHVDLSLNYENHYFSWWIDSSKIRDFFIKDKNFFLDTLYSDKDFYKKYLIELNKYSKIKYFEELISENKEEFNNFNKILTRNYPTKKIFSFDHLEITRSRIQDFLNPSQGINVYFVDYLENFLILNISNIQRLPIEVLGIEFNDNTKLYINVPNLINGKKPASPLENNIIKIDCKFKEECKKMLINKQKIIFKILGQETERKAEISQHYFKSK